MEQDHSCVDKEKSITLLDIDNVFNLVFQNELIISYMTSYL